MADDRGERDGRDPLEALISKVDIKMNFLNDVTAQHREIKQVISGVMKEKESLQQEKERLQQEKERFLHEQRANVDALAAMKEDLLSSKNTLVAARDALLASTEEISGKNNYVEFLEKKLQESEAKNNQAEQQSRNVTEPIIPRGVQTRSSQKRKRPSERPLDYDSDIYEPTTQLDSRSQSPLESLENSNVQTRSMKMNKKPLGNDAGNLPVTKELPRQEVANNPTAGQMSGVLLCDEDEDDLEAVRDELIKGFLEIDCGRRKLGIKEMGELSEKKFKTACLAKIPPEEVGAAFYQLYSSWQQRLGDLSWYPFRSVRVDGNCQEIVNLDDDALQELKRVWGQDAHNAVVTALVEMKEYDRLSDRTIAYELWNYKEGRKATTRECVQYLCNQVKLLSVAKRRKTRRSSGRA